MNNNNSGPVMVSQLPLHSIRWMNKRTSNIVDRVTSHILPSRTEELRAVFNLVDVENSGLLTITTLKDAVRFYNRSYKKSDGFLTDKKSLESFFAKMDKNSDGFIEFSEFLAIMGSEVDVGEYARTTAKLQVAMHNYGVYLRRKKCNDLIITPGQSDLEICKNFRGLFVMKYFEDKKIEMNTEEVCMERFRREVKEINSTSSRHYREIEVERARTAADYFRLPKASSSRPNTTTSKSFPKTNRSFEFPVPQSFQQLRSLSEDKIANDNSSLGGNSIASSISHNSSVFDRPGSRAGSRCSSRRKRNIQSPVTYSGENDIILSRQLLLPDLVAVEGSDFDGDDGGLSPWGWGNRLDIPASHSEVLSITSRASTANNKPRSASAAVLRLMERRLN